MKLDKIIGYVAVGIASAVMGVVQQIITEKDISREVHDQLEEAMKH